MREAGFCRTPNRSDSLIRFMTAQELIMDYFDLLPQRSAEDLLKHLFSAQTNTSESPQNSPDLPDTDQPKQNLSVPQLIQDDQSGLSQPKSPNMDVNSSGSHNHSCVCLCVCTYQHKANPRNAGSQEVGIMPLKTCFWHLSGPFGAKFSVLCFGWGLIFHSHLWTLWTRLSVDYGCSYLLSPRQHRSTTGLCVEPRPHPRLRLNLKHSHVSRPLQLDYTQRVSPGGGLPSTSGPAVSEMMIVLPRDLLPDLQQDINHHQVMHHSPSCGCQALGESVSNKGHRSDPAWDRQPSLVDQFSRTDEQLSYMILNS